VTEVHYCENCKEHEAEVKLAAPGGETKFLCTSPECLMSAGMCPDCNVDLDVKVKDTGETVYTCPSCTFEVTYKDMGQA
jgi:ribosomal protein L37AE/L43A